MKYLGIDYGEKRIGLALSDDGAVMAFPKEIVQNDEKAVQNIAELCGKEKVEAIVMGESKDFAGKENPVMKKAKGFAEKIKAATGLQVFFEPEFLTSHEAAQKMNAVHRAGSEREDGRAGRSPEKKERVDANAAAIVLQSFLDKQKQN